MRSTRRLSLALLLLLQLSLSSGYGIELLSAASRPIDTSQSDEPVELAVLNPAAGSERQPIPSGWSDNSSWADLEVSYTQSSFEGVPHLRIECTRFTSGRVQFIYRPAGLRPGKLYQLSFEARAPKPVSLTAQIRRSQSPYTSYWQQGFNIESRFKQYEAIVVVEKDTEGSYFILAMEQVGTLDLRSLTLRRIEDQGEEAKAPPRNLTRNSRFPLGLPDTSMIWRTTPDSRITIAPDADTPGPSGAPSLHLVSPPGEELRFDGDIFAVHRRTSVHSAQFMAKGHGKVRFAIVADGKVLKEQSFPLSEDWSPIQMSFQPKASSNLHLCRWQLEGEMWIDSLVINAGASPIDYAAQPRMEVALKLVDSDASIANIQFEDEPALLKYAVTGMAPKAAYLETALYHVDGSRQELTPRPLQADRFLQQDRLDLSAIWPERSLGTFRIEARVVDADGQALSPWAEVVWHRMMRPRHWGEDAPDSAFGAHLNSTERHITMAKAIGINWVRLHDAGGMFTNWFWMEQQPGQWQFFEQDLQRYRDGHLKILGMLATAPKWASYYATEKGEGDDYFDRFFLPRDPEKDYANYVETVTTRYLGLIDTYEVWNEPWQLKWFTRYWVDGKRRHPDDPQGEYVRLSKIAYETAKAVDPGMTIVGLNTTSMSKSDPDYAISGTDWTKGILDQGGLDYADVASIHIYNNNPGGYPESSIDQALAVGVGPNESFDRIDKPVWMSEGSSTYTKLAMGFYRRSLPAPVLDANERYAESVLRYQVSLLSRGVEKIFLYAMHVGGIKNTSAFSSLVSRDGSLHPSALAHANLAWHVEDMDFHRVVEIAPKVWLYTWQNANRSAAVLLPESIEDLYQIDVSLVPEVRNIWGNRITESNYVPTSGTFINAPGLSADAIIDALETGIPAKPAAKVEPETEMEPEANKTTPKIEEPKTDQPEEASKIKRFFRKLFD